MAHILVVDDEEDLVWAVSSALRYRGYTVSCAYDGVSALQQMHSTLPDLLVLDIGMPDMDGLEVCQRVRSDPQLQMMPIVILTARSEIHDKIIAYQSGADDYLTKPFDLRELGERVRAVLRRCHRNGEEKNPLEPEVSVLRVGGLFLDIDTAIVETEVMRVRLTPIELDLLTYLMKHAGRISSSETLLQNVWGYPPGTGDPALVRWHIKNLRGKIEIDPANPIYLSTIPRHGYTILAPIPT